MKTRVDLVVNFLLLLAALPVSSHFYQEFGPFNSSYYRVFEVLSPASISNDALQVTPDSASSDFSLTNRSGRILYKQPFKLWGGKRTVSFETSFLLNFYRLKDSEPGEGLAFVVAPDLNLPPNSYGQYLGLTNSTTDGNSTNQFIAVELDTCKQDFDPNDNHIGLDINGVASPYYATSLMPLGIEIAPVGEAVFHNVWVQYNGRKKIIKVYIAQQANRSDPTPPRPDNPVLTSDLDLKDVLRQYSYFGFSSSTGSSNPQLNTVLRWTLMVEYLSDEKVHNLNVIFLGTVLTGSFILVVTAGLVYYWYRRKTVLSKSRLLDSLRCLPGMPREFHLKDLKQATNNFAEKNKLGQGGFGVVYRGFIPSENLEVAVKCFSGESMKGENDFLAELTIINRLRHKHLVRLLGWCHKNGKLLLVYDYMPMGSLDAHIFVGANREPLPWSVRYKVISGVASALQYLHHDFDQKVVHRDLKASNIMLDSNFDAHLGDFGLARALENEKHSYTAAGGLAGTRGYIAPECFLTGKATQQSDIYAFGAVLLEVACGLRPGTEIGEFQSLVDWVWCLHREGRLLEAVGQRLGQEYVENEARRVFLLGLACSHPIAGERPTAQEIVRIISGLMEVPNVPPFKPSFIWSSMPTGAETGSFTRSYCSQAMTTPTGSFTREFGEVLRCQVQTL